MTFSLQKKGGSKVQKNSTYNKIWEILTAAQHNERGIGHLANAIHGNTEAFVYYKREPTRVVREYPCSRAAIRRAIRFCIALGLIESQRESSLTDTGRQALIEGQFDAQLQQAILSFLEKNGLLWKEIARTIAELPLPDAASLYAYLSPSVKEQVFRRCLCLLSQCGQQAEENILHSYENRLYLTEERIEQAEASLSKGGDQVV